MFKPVREALACIDTGLTSVEAASSEDLRDALRSARSLRTKVELLETKAALAIAERERHGDGGAGLLNQIGGLSRSEASRNARVDAELAEVPAARESVNEGEMSLANAAKLAQVARKTSSDAVQNDPDLVEMAKSLPTDEFAQVAQRWTIQHQSAAELSEQHRRNRRNRSVRFWNGDDGSVQMRGAFDAEMGARIQARLRREAEILRQADRRRQRRLQSNREGQLAAGAVRSRDQRMADALDGLANAQPSTAATQPSAAVPNPELPTSGKSGPELPLTEPPVTEQSAGIGDVPQAAAPDTDSQRIVARTEIIVRTDLPSLMGQAGGFAEIAGSGPIPPSAVERLICNSDLSIVLRGHDLTPLFEAVASRAPTAAQWRALIARDGACIGCGAPPGECEAHHVLPWKSGGKTRIDNLVLVCWSCHDRVHDDNWRVVRRSDRYRLVPPDPQHRHNPAPSRKPGMRRSNGHASPDKLLDQLDGISRAEPDRPSGLDPPAAA